MTSVDILGSCVTRDAFAFIENDFKINSYYPRSSLISIYSPAINIKKEGIALDSEYMQRLVFWDMTKQPFNYIKNTTSDFLIIDFMDERLGVLKVQDTYITHSDELKQSQIKKLFETKILEFDEHYFEKWEISALKFIHDVKKRPYKKIILHKAFYMDTYITKDGIRQLISDSELVNRIEVRNKLLSRMYNFIERNMPNLEIIQPTGFSADEKHKWGFQPFHYELGYYESLMNNLKNLTLSEALV